MKDLILKLAKAKNKVQSEKLNKNAKNDYSGYKYFSPEYVEVIVQRACKEFGLFTKFDLIRDEFGEVGVLSVYDLESGDSLEWKMATAVPKITATNETQQLGGASTYTERYLKMTAFGIVDNSMDFDTTENTYKRNETKKELPWLNIFDSGKNYTPQWLNAVEAINNKTVTSISQLRSYYKISKDVEQKINELLNYEKQRFSD